MVNTQKTISLKFPAVANLPIIIKKPMFAVAKKLVYENEINSFLKSHTYMGPFEFIDTVLDYFDFSYKFSSNQIENIPPSGRVIIIANHPLGALDALFLIRLIKQVRSDVKVVANDTIDIKTKVKLFKKHLYNIAKN